jgi:hypothetical protein
MYRVCITAWQIELRVLHKYQQGTALFQSGWKYLP